jgi:hypothetical protein
MCSAGAVIPMSLAMAGTAASLDRLGMKGRRELYLRYFRFIWKTPSHGLGGGFAERTRQRSM